jgi:hypothetical protein
MVSFLKEEIYGFGFIMRLRAAPRFAMRLTPGGAVSE